MTTDLRVASRTDVGQVRDGNEDAVFAGRHVFAVADGLGGHRAGEVASQVALEAIAALDQNSPKDAAKRVAEAVRRGNRTVFERAQTDEDLKGMGTTMTAVVVADGTAHLAHVGDSRCYLIRGSSISRVSRDHTLVARMVDEGKLTAEQAEAHPQRSILTRALGAERDVDVEEVRIQLVSGDRLLLCSDGLTGVLADEEIRTLASDGSDLDEITASLVDEANRRGGPDNISVVVVDVGATVPAPRTAGRRIPASIGARRGGRFPVRPLIWGALIACVVLGGMLGVDIWANRSFYVGVSGEQVVIYRGLPVEVPGMDLADVEEPTELKLAEIRNPALRRSVEQGIRAPSLEAARAIIEERLVPAASPKPSSSGAPSPSPSKTGALGSPSIGPSALEGAS